MAIETLGQLSRGAAGKTVPLRIELRALKPKDRAPWRVFDDWAREDDKAEVMGQLASRNGLQLTSKVGAPPHGRSIELAFEGGRRATILLDQGFGAWSTSAAPRFAFNESAARQVNALAESDFRVAAQGSTYVVAHVS